MLKELRQALRDTLEAGMPEARVLAAPPAVLEWPSSNLLVWVQPADPWIDAWLTMSTNGRGVVNFDVVVTVPASDQDDSDPSYAALDDAVDPLSDAGSVFAAILADPSLGVTSFQVSSVSMLGGVAAPDVTTVGDVNAVRYVAVVPVQITVQRS